ncbi:MAG: hypothetical protein GKR86_01025 [Ilumatobacter sp.]|nr:hypothetical protein [Ilumatobacter sp.]
MTYDPMPHQIEDSDELLKYRHGLLFADAGTGKTYTVLEAFRKGKYTHILVVAPKIALTMWKKELLKHTTCKAVCEVRNSTMSAKKARMLQEADAIVVTYDVARNPTISNHLKRWSFGHSRNGVVCAALDESDRVRSVTAKRAVALLGPAFDGEYSPLAAVEDVWFMTGDPVKRHVDDLFTQLRFARPHILRHYNVDTYEKFVNEFCIVQYKKYHPRQVSAKKVITGSKNLDKLNELLDACRVIRRKLTDVWKDMPPYSERILNPDLADKLPTGLVKGMTDGQLAAALADPNSELAKMRKLVGMAKVEAVSMYVNDQRIGNVLIGCWHRDVMDFYEETLRDMDHEAVIAQVHGGVPTKQRDQIQQDFNNGTIDFLIGQMGAMEVSWNLQDHCRHIVIAEELPSPGMDNQFIARVYRAGQQNAVVVDRMTSPHEVDEALTYLRNSKAVVKAKTGT